MALLDRACNETAGCPAHSRNVAGWEGEAGVSPASQNGVDFQTQRIGQEKWPEVPKKIKLFNGRDHSWMQFNRRVLEEAEDPANPLLERVKFLAITGSNLDEYVEIRQAGLMQRIEDGYREPGYDGLRPDESLAALTAEIHSFVAAQYHCWNKQLLPELRKQGIRLLEWDELERRRARVRPRLLSARGRSAADADLDRSGTSRFRAC